MNRYRVLITQTCTHFVDVEADDPEQARAAAIAHMEQRDASDNTLVGCEVRHGDRIMLNPPDWKPLISHGGAL